MLFNLPLFCVLGGVFWTIVLSFGLSAYSCSKALKRQPVGYSNAFQFFTFIWLGSVLLIVIGTVLGKLLGVHTWNHIIDMIGQLLKPNTLDCPTFGTQHGDLSMKVIQDIFQPRSGSPMTKKDCDAFISHLKDVPSKPIGQGGLYGPTGPTVPFSSSRRGMQTRSSSFPPLTGRTPWRADAEAR